MSQALRKEIPLGIRDETVLCAVVWRQSVIWLGSGFSFLCALIVLAAIPNRGLLTPVLTSAGFLVVAVWAFLLGRSGLVLSEREVQWRDKWRTRHWRWDEIEGFDFAPSPGRRSGSVTLTSGEVVPFQVLAAERPGEEEKGRELIEDLRRRLHYQREAGGR